MKSSAHSNIPSAATLAVWQHAVDHRNTAFDGAFYYAVKTTGIFCLASCPSRRAKSEHREYFKTTAQALAAGYRACPRCQPLAHRAQAPAVKAIRAVCEYISSHAEQHLPLARLAKISGFSPTHLQRTFTETVGVSPKDFQAAIRLKTLKTALRADLPVLEAGARAGLSSTSRLHAKATSHLGMTPSAYRAGGAGESITYLSQKTDLGLLMIGATERGICFVQFAADEKTLIALLQEEFPKATLKAYEQKNHSQLRTWLQAITHYLDHPAPRPDLPLDIRGTAFQVRVWNCLLTVREGEVLSYQELATRLNTPTAFRAVASACARNRIAVLIPCHRILRSDGTLGGYRWGLDRKVRLLEREQAYASRSDS